jgi:hypothetical protein
MRDQPARSETPGRSKSSSSWNSPRPLAVIIRPCPPAPAPAISGNSNEIINCQYCFGMTSTKSDPDAANGRHGSNPLDQIPVSNFHSSHVTTAERLPVTRRLVDGRPGSAAVQSLMVATMASTSYWRRTRRSMCSGSTVDGLYLISRGHRQQLGPSRRDTRLAPGRRARSPLHRPTPPRGHCRS